MKRDPHTGRFVTYLCEECGDEGTVMCPRCNGSGEGMADGLQCMGCRGAGAVPCDGEAHLTDDEWRETHFVLSGWGRGAASSGVREPKGASSGNNYR